MVKFIQVQNFGGPEEMLVRDRDRGDLNENEVFLRHLSVGINYADVLARKGSFQISVPFTPGIEAVGVIEAIGSNVTNFEVGDRVAYVNSELGAYCESRVIDNNKLMNVPDYVESDDVAACLMKGMTAHFLTRRTFFVRENNLVLVQGAGSGVGFILVQMLKSQGAKVVATTSSEIKAETLKEYGADLVIDVDDEDLVKKIMDFTNNEGVNVAYDFYGQKTLKKSHDCLGLFGLLVCAGFPDRVPSPISHEDIYQKSSFITTPNFFHYKSDKMELVLTANEIYAQLQKKLLKPLIYRKYKLEEAPEAHRNIENRKQLGQSIFSL